MRYEPACRQAGKAGNGATVGKPWVSKEVDSEVPSQGDKMNKVHGIK